MRRSSPIAHCGAFPHLTGGGDGDAASKIAERQVEQNQDDGAEPGRGRVLAKRMGCMATGLASGAGLGGGLKLNSRPPASGG